jgi:transposase
VRRYVGSVRPAAKAEAFLKLSTLPGEQAQVDWGHFGEIQVGAATRSLSCFVLVLSWSRAMYARFTLDQTLETFLRGHALAFETLGGAARRILYDNLKSVVVERVGDHIRFHPQILECAGHYHFAPVPCAPYRGNEKGKVERTIQYLRHGFFAARRFTPSTTSMASSPSGSSASRTHGRSPAIRRAGRCATRSSTNRRGCCRCQPTDSNAITHGRSHRASSPTCASTATTTRSRTTASANR